MKKAELKNKEILYTIKVLTQQVNITKQLSDLCRIGHKTGTIQGSIEFSGLDQKIQVFIIRCIEALKSQAEVDKQHRQYSDAIEKYIIADAFALTAVKKTFKNIDTKWLWFCFCDILSKADNDSQVTYHARLREIARTEHFLQDPEVQKCLSRFRYSHRAGLKNHPFAAPCVDNGYGDYELSADIDY